MRILFLVAKLHSIEPFGIMSLSPHLKRDGHEVRLFEAERESLVEDVRAYSPHIIAYSVCTGSDAYYLALNQWLKERFQFVSVFGGPHPTFFPDIISATGVDAICRGEGDLAFADFCREMERFDQPKAVANFAVKSGTTVLTASQRPLVANLDSLPFPDRELYYSVSPEIAGHRVRSFLASRGCPFACTYCFNHAMDNLYDGAWKHVRVRSPANLVEEIAQVTRRYATTFVAFRESIFPLNTEWLEQFGSEYSKRIGLPFYCHVRLDLLNETNVALLAKAGCHSVNVGIETGNEEIRRDLLGRKMTNEQMVLACRMLRRRGIRILANNMLGLPGCTLEHDFETLALNQKCRPDYALAMLWQPYPGTVLGDAAKQKGYYRGDFKDLDFTYYSRSHVEFRSAGEKRRIENLQKLFAMAVAVPVLTPLVKLLTRLPPNRVFDTIFRTMYLIFHQTEIFPHTSSGADWRKKILHIAGEK